jgi:ferrous iron transport protein B
MNKATLGLLGNPNSGKSTLFNALTGARQKVGNWPGVTVERKTGQLDWQGWQLEVIDLPGVYSLTASTDETSLDSSIACDAILSDRFDLIVNILDASNLERNLYLTTQLLEMGTPVIVVVNMMDIAQKRRIRINIDALSLNLKCPVIGICANKKTGIKELKNLIVASCQQRETAQVFVKFPVEFEQIVTNIEQSIHDTYHAHARCFALRLLENDTRITNLFSDEMLAQIKTHQTHIETAMHEEVDIIMADARYSQIHTLCQRVIQQQNTLQRTLTHFIDNIVLNRILGIPIFLFVMYLMFFFSINVGGVFQDFFDISSDALFVQGLTHLLQSMHTPSWLTAVIASGIGKGINTTLTFIPVIGSLFLFLSFLEASGYMARAAFVMDRFMRALGLPGKSFVPMIVGFGCNVPGIMAARTLENKRDRILTIMMSPFMSCGARLAIYAVFTAAFFPVGGQNIVFALYIIGILMAIVTGLILRKTVLQGEPSPLVMELPPYHLPTFRALTQQTWHRLKSFILRAGKVIVPVCMLLGALNSISIHGKLNQADADQDSILSAIGRSVTPLFAPMGISQDNWPATVGLISGVLAKEVVVGTLNTLYSQDANLQSASTESFQFWQSLKAAVLSIPQNIIGLKDSFGNPILASAPIQTVDQRVLGVMYSHFDGQLGAMAYLLFILLYFPCISATAAMLRELNRGWTIFSMTWTTGLAYAVAVLFYQTATFIHHPLSSTVWGVTLTGLFLAALWTARNRSEKITC